MVVADLGHRRRVIRTERQRQIRVTIEWLDKDRRVEDELVTIESLTKDRPVTADLVHHRAVIQDRKVTADLVHHRVVIQGQNGSDRTGTPSSGCE